jgi:hypothetical protein
MEKILIIGEDPVLLFQRAALLQQSGASVAFCDLAQLDAHPWNEMIDLVVLCHSLKPGVHRSVVVAEIYRRWPNARILQAIAGPGEPVSTSDLVVGDMGERGNLLDLSIKLLRKSPKSEWYPDIDRFDSQRAS